MPKQQGSIELAVFQAHWRIHRANEDGGLAKPPAKNGRLKWIGKGRHHRRFSHLVITREAISTYIQCIWHICKQAWKHEKKGSKT